MKRKQAECQQRLRGEIKYPCEIKAGVKDGVHGGVCGDGQVGVQHIQSDDRIAEEKKQKSHREQGIAPKSQASEQQIEDQIDIIKHGYQRQRVGILP